MIEVKINKKIVQVPQTWNELNRAQLLTITKVMPFQIAAHEGDDENDKVLTNMASRFRILRSLLGLTWGKFTKIEPDQLTDIMFLTDFIFKKDSLDLTQDALQYFGHNFQVYLGPGTELENSTIHELTTADTYFIRYIQTKDEALLDLLVAALFRPRKRFLFLQKRQVGYNGDKRREISDYQVKRHAKRLKKLPPHIKLAVLYQYTGFRKWMCNQFENIFPKPDESSKTERVGNDYGWGGTLLELSGDKFGDFNATSKMNWYSIFVEMSRLKDKAKQIEKQMEK